MSHIAEKDTKRINDMGFKINDNGKYQCINCDGFLFYIYRWNDIGLDFYVCVNKENGVCYKDD